MAILRISALVWADILADYSTWMVMTYLRDVWKLNLTHAAGILNVWNGLTLILPLPVSFLVDSFMGNFSMVLLSSIAYCTGLGLLTTTTTPGLGKCDEHRPECISEAQKALFYTALPLISVGISGHLVSLQSFYRHQHLSEDEAETDYTVTAEHVQEATSFYAKSCGFSYLPMIGGIALFHIKPWLFRFGIPTICSVMATIFFLSGSCSYRRRKPGGSPLTTTFRVLVASASKMFHPCSNDRVQLYERRDMTDQDQPLSRTHGFRCLDKAAMILPTQPLDRQESNRWRLCRITEVEETKIVLWMFPAWLTLIICGVVSSIGNTYFLEQADHMDRKVLTLPLPILLMVHDASKAIFALLYVVFAVCFIGERPKRYTPIIGTAVSTIFAALCCIAAAKIETRRLNDREIAKTSIVSLFPQYILLGGLGGISKQSMFYVFFNQSPRSIRLYLVRITNGFLGLGVILNVVAVDVIGKASGGGGKSSWFQNSLDRSRLDNYYWVLAGLSGLNLLLCVLMSFCYRCRGFSGEGLEEDEVRQPMLA